MGDVSPKKIQSHSQPKINVDKKEQLFNKRDMYSSTDKSNLTQGCTLLDYYSLELLISTNT